MKADNMLGENKKDSDGLTSQVENVFSELLRVQEELQGRLRAFSQREADVNQRTTETSERERELERRSKALGDREAAINARFEEIAERERELASADAELASAHAELATLEERASALEVSQTKLADREKELLQTEQRLDAREREIAGQEANLVALRDCEAELIEREDQCRRRREEVGARAALLERLEIEAAARDTILQQREHALEKVCAMLATTAAALADPRPENVEAATQAASAAAQAYRACQLAEQHAGATCEVPSATTHSDTEPATAAADKTSVLEDVLATQKTAQDGDQQIDIADFSPDELQRLRMLRKLGTASAVEIVTMIRAERESTAAGKSKKKRLGLF
jgi:DNA repair exonuclease SbcCD ATPase subunit